MKRMSTLLNKLGMFVIALLLVAGNAQAQTPQYTFTNSTNSCNHIPFGTSTLWAPYRSQFLYPPGDFPTLNTPGFITTIYFRTCGNTGGMTLNNLQVSIGNTAVTNLTGYVTGLPIARPASNFSTGALSSGDWWAIPLTTPIYIQPNQSICVDIQKTNATGAVPTFSGGNPINSAYSGNRTHAYSSSSSGSPSTRNYSYAFGFDLFAGFPCTDTPKTSVNGPIRVCPNRPYTVSPDSFYSDADYVWQYSNNGINWSNFTGVPGLYGEIIDSITSPRWYRVKVTCKADAKLTWTSPPHKVEIAPFYYCYCLNSVDEDAGADIGNVTIINSNQLDTILDKSKLVTGTGVPPYGNVQANNRYTAYHDSLSWPCLYRDTNYIFHISQIHPNNTFITGVVQAYIDYNRDGIYNPNTERIFLHALDGTANPEYQLKTSATIPADAKTGLTGMRIIISEDTVKGGPCGTLDGGGEVEDYIVEICHRPCNGPVNAGKVEVTDTSMCAGYEYRVTDTSYEQQRSGFSRAWQRSGDNITWFNVTNSTDKDTLQRVFQGQPLYYRLRTICSTTHDTAYSNPTLINTKPGYKCYCYSKATGGLGVDTSDIGGVTIAAYTSNAGGPHLLNTKALMPRTDFTDQTPIEIFTDSIYKFELFHTMPVPEHGDAKITVFMDFNNNHEYDIPQERIYTGYTTIGNHTLVDNVEVPVNAITDVPTGMRVIVNNDVGPNIPSDEACGPYQSGETEDYLLIFRKKWPQDVNKLKVLTGFSVHPNPTDGKFNINFSTPAKLSEVEVRVTSLTGQLLMSEVYTHEGGMFSQSLDMSGKASGVYFVELQADGQRLMKKLVLR